MSTSPIETVCHETAELIAPTPGEPLAYKQEGQNIALINVAHTGLRVRSEGGAAFRCMGIFKDKAALKKHFGNLPDDGYETLAHQCRAWKLIPPRPSPSADAESDAIKSIQMQDEKRRVDSLVEFERRRKLQADFKNTHTPQKKAERKDGVEVKMPSACTVPAQEYTCVGIVRGKGRPKEASAIVMFLAAFATEAECRRYMRDTAAMQHDVDLFCVKMYQWCSVADAYSCENMGFRHKKLDDFFQTRYNDNIEAAQFRMKMAESKEIASK